MRLARFLFSAIPYGFVALFALWQTSRPPAFHFNELLRRAPDEPNEATGEVWRVVRRTGEAVYLTQADYLAYWSPFVVVPAFMIAVLWIMRDWYRAGVLDLFDPR